MLTLLAVAIMLLEPVLVSSQRETVPSHLVIVARRLREHEVLRPVHRQFAGGGDWPPSLKLESAGGQVAGRAAARDAAAGPGQDGPPPEPGGAGAGPGAVRLRPGIGGQARLGRVGASRASSTTSRPKRPISPAGRRDPRRAGGASGPAGRRRDPGDRRTLQHRRRPAPRRRGRRPAEHPDLRDRRRGRRRPAEHPRWPRSRSARSSSCATR